MVSNPDITKARDAYRGEPNIVLKTALGEEYVAMLEASLAKGDSTPTGTEATEFTALIKAATRALEATDATLNRVEDKMSIATPAMLAENRVNIRYLARMLLEHSRALNAYAYPSSVD
jgi:hypothetical protein